MQCITDFAAKPSFEADIRCFTSGLVIERMNRTNHIPVAISFASDVEKVWIVDIADVLWQVTGSALIGNKFDLKWLEELFPGHLIVFSLKGVNGADTSPLSRLFQQLSPEQSLSYLGLFVSHGRRQKESTAGGVFPALESWKIAFRVNDITVALGRSSPLPIEILRSFIVMVDGMLSVKSSADNIYRQGGHSCRAIFDCISGYCLGYGSPGISQLAQR